MPQAAHPTIEARRDQMFPVLEPANIARLARFGERRSYAAGEPIFTTGEVAPGAFIILSGRADSSLHRLGRSDPIVTHGPGSFMGELAQLSGRPSLVDAVAIEPVETLVILPRRLRDLLVEEAELGERIMRALILRRMGLIETGAGGPVIVGRADNGDVLRLRGFLRRNGHPHQQLDPETDPEAKALVERFHVDPGQLPIVLCPGGQLLHNPGEVELARCGRTSQDPATCARHSFAIVDIVFFEQTHGQAGARSFDERAVHHEQGLCGDGRNRAIADR